jgi:hypothetical protein
MQPALHAPATDPHLVSLTRRAIARKRGSRTRAEVLLADVSRVVEGALRDPFRALERFELVALRHGLDGAVRRAAEARGVHPILAAISPSACFRALGVEEGGAALIDAALAAVRGPA